MPSPPKVFGIGFHKTSTSSLANALYTLGYSVTGHFGEHDRQIAERALAEAFRLADRYDAAQDTPWPVLYRELDQRYPGSKFVLTVRDADAWVASVVKHFKDGRIATHEWIYGVDVAAGNEDVYRRRYERHNRDVLEYFADRPRDLLVMDITEGDGWEKLCPFLDAPIPPMPFPRENVSRRRRRDALVRLLRSAVRRSLAGGAGRSGGGPAVSPAFVRDLIHYHDRAFRPVVEALAELAADVRASDDGQEVAQILLDQMADEQRWLTRLVAVDRASGEAPASSAPEAVAELWNRHRTVVRRSVADLSAEDFGSVVQGGQMLAWEVLVDLVARGTERRTRIVERLAQLGVDVRVPSFLEVFHGSGADPITADPAQ